MKNRGFAKTQTQNKLLNIMKKLETLKLPLYATCAAVAIGSLTIGHAQSITIPDFSFESPTTGGFQDNSGIAAGSVIPNTGNAWYYLGGFTAGGSPVGVQNVAANGFTAGANPDGTQDGYVNVGAWMGSGALTTIQANSTYTLTVSEGNRGGGFAQTAGFTIAMAFGSAVGTGLTNSADWASSHDVSYAGSPAVGTFADYNISFTTGAADSSIGQSLFVLLGSDVAAGNNPIDYDNVRLVVTPVPEPSSMALAALGSLGLCLFRRRR
jgi:hypothetical protein